MEDHAENNKTIGTIDAFREFAKMAPKAASIWKKALSSASSSGFINTLVTDIPLCVLSPVRVQWLRAVLEHNANAIDQNT